MASHAGLILVFKTKDGYIDEQGNITNDKNKARKVTFYEAGFSNPLHILKKLNLDSNQIDKDSLSLETLIPSYDSRIGYIEEYLREMGYDYKSAYYEASRIFNSYNLSNYDKFLKYLKEIELKTIEYYKSHSQGISSIISGEELTLYPVDNPYTYETPEYKKEKYYTNEGSLYKYSIVLKNPHVEKYFNLPQQELDSLNNWQNTGIIEYLSNLISSLSIPIKEISIKDNRLNIYASSLNEYQIEQINKAIRDFYSKREMHITRMFGSYIILRREDGVLASIKATSVPIKYCPLMIKLLEEVGHEKSTELISAIKEGNQESSSKLMCKLIDEVVIKGGYFDTSRPLNSCEANVIFGASETISSGFKSNLLDAAVIVSNNLGTIITTNSSNTQGAVKRMTGLFYTTPNEEIMTTARNSNIIPVFPYTGEIDQIAGLKEAIKKGYKKIAVTFAASDNNLLKYISYLEQTGITIYKFGLCSTGITEETAKIMQENADIIWSCASKYVKEIIEPNAIAQVGIKIPVHIMTKKGWELVRNHLELMNTNSLDDISLSSGETKPVLLNSNGTIKKLIKKDIRKCTDCPSPCI